MPEAIPDLKATEEPGPGGATPGRVVSLVYDADSYSRSVEGVDIEVVRTGVGVGPSIVRTVQTDRLVATESTVQFPMFSRATIGDDHIVVARIAGVAPGSRWCGIDIKPGMVVAYGSGAEHTAVNPVGVRFAFATVALEDLAAIADDRRRRFAPPPPGQVHALKATADTGSLARQLGRYVGEAVDGQMTTNELDQRLLDATTVVLSEDRRSERVGAAKRIDPRRVTGTCIEYARAVGRIPSITELCLVAHISERGLRRAFNENLRDVAGGLLPRLGTRRGTPQAEVGRI